MVCNAHEDGVDVLLSVKQLMSMQAMPRHNVSSSSSTDQSKFTVLKVASRLLLVSF